MYGTVNWFNPEKGYGFITVDDPNAVEPEDLFVHFSNIAEKGPDGRRNLEGGQRVSFDIGEFNGREQAENVEVIS